MTRVTVAIDGQEFEGYFAFAGAALLRIISRFEGRPVPIDELHLPVQIQAEMVMAEIATAYSQAAVEPQLATGAI